MSPWSSVSSWILFDLHLEASTLSWNLAIRPPWSAKLPPSRNQDQNQQQVWLCSPVPTFAASQETHQNKSPRVCSAFSSISRSVQPPNGRRLSANAARRWLFGSISHNPLLAGRGRCCDLHKSWTKFDLEVWRGREVAFIMAQCWSSPAKPELIIAFKRTASNIDQTFIPFSAFVIKINFWASFHNVKQNMISSSLSLKISFLNSLRCISYLHQFWWRMLDVLLDS